MAKVEFSVEGLYSEPNRIIATGPGALDMNGDGIADYTTNARHLKQAFIRGGRADDLIDMRRLGITPEVTETTALGRLHNRDEGHQIGGETVYGTPYADSIGANLAWGGAGNDVLSGRYGKDDILYGGPGRDALKANSGNDRLYGGRGNDWMTGGPGNDLYFGGDGNDKTGECGSVSYDYGGIDTYHMGEGRDHVCDTNMQSIVFLGPGNDKAYLRTNARYFNQQRINCGTGIDDTDLSYPHRTHCEYPMFDD